MKGMELKFTEQKDLLGSCWPSAVRDRMWTLSSHSIIFTRSASLKMLNRKFQHNMNMHHHVNSDNFKDDLFFQHSLSVAFQRSKNYWNRSIIRKVLGDTKWKKMHGFHWNSTSCFLTKFRWASMSLHGENFVNSEKRLELQMNTTFWLLVRFWSFWYRWKAKISKIYAKRKIFLKISYWIL